ncbi:MAG: hypothetical protein KAS07_04885 [Candidatus Pacebacteria bacterium]|nr:hypothetical protein [Candidatus Paceibacterota bacterium]
MSKEIKTCENVIQEMGVVSGKLLAGEDIGIPQKNIKNAIDAVGKQIMAARSQIQYAQARNEKPTIPFFS